MDIRNATNYLKSDTFSFSFILGEEELRLERDIRQSDPFRPAKFVLGMAEVDHRMQLAFNVR